MRHIARLIAGTRERLRAIFFATRADAEMEEELRFHVEMEAQRLEKSGLEPGDAARVAAARLGGVQRYKEEVREARGLAWLSTTALDVTLGLRMMRKHPALSVVGGIGIAVGVATSVGMFAFLRANVYPTLPLDEGERIVALENRAIERGTDNEERRSVHDFVTWRQAVTTVEDIGAFRDVVRNLSVADGAPSPVLLAEMSAAGFRVARVAPVRGRYLVDDDERPGAPPVAVIGYDLWQSKFAGRPDVLGREIRLAGVPHTVVGVMPDEFRFPRDHSLWVPFRANPGAHKRREGPAIYMYGRLAPGVSMEQAQSELSAIGKQASALYPENATLSPMVMPYIHSLTDIQGLSVWFVVEMQLVMTLLLVVVAVNVSMLVYARTATRQTEIAVRTALGASRARIVTQLFIEALTLSTAASLVGLGLAHVGLRYGQAIMQEDIGTPFWIDYTVDGPILLFTMAVAVFAAIIVGVAPALKVTGKHLQAGLRSASGGAMRLGRIWTTLIIAQVAVAVAALPNAVGAAWRELGQAFNRPTYDASRYAVGTLEIEQTNAEGRGLRPTGAIGDRLREVIRRISEEPGVEGASYWAGLPGRSGRVEAEGVLSPAGTLGHRVRSNGVALSYLPLYQSRILAGRTLGVEDLDTTATSVVVTRAFVDQVFKGETAVGRRIRYARPAAANGDAPERSRWYRIVGVIDDFERNSQNPEVIVPEIYYAVAPEYTHLATQIDIIVRSPDAHTPQLASRMRQAAAVVDPTFRLGTIRAQSDLERQTRLALRLVSLGLGLVLVSVFLLSAAGIYALVSFTVTRRRKEIGIRTALGASQAQVLHGVLGPVGSQIALGVIIGVMAAMAIDKLGGGEMLGDRAAILLPLFSTAMSIVALLAAFGPARRGLRTQPTEALRAEA